MHTIAQALVAELQFESDATHRVLERVPVDRLDWRPHEKSMTLGRLAGHIAEVPRWAKETIENRELDLDQLEMEPYVASNREELLTRHREEVDRFVSVVAPCSDEALLESWKLLQGGQEIFSLPRAVVLRNFVLNHVIHHRAQMTVYLRLLDVPVPSVYGPTADEG